MDIVGPREDLGASWEVGMVVQLKSGGQRMTIDEIRPDGIVDVLWFVGPDLRRDAFDPRELMVPPNG